MSLKRIIFIMLTVLLALTACKNKTPQADKRIGLEDKQPVMVEILETRTLDEYISVSGKLEGATDVNMTSETSGRILQLYKKLGDKVAKGEKIGKVENDVYRIRLEQAEAAKLSSEAALETAQINLNTAEALLKTQSVSQAQYNTILSAFKGAKAALDGAKAGLEAARLAYDNSYLAAPEGGTISNLMVNVGQYINQGTPIAYITDDKTLLIKTGVGETQIGKLKKGLAAEIYVPGKELPVKGFIKGFGIRPLTTSATYPLEIQLNSTSGLFAGMVVTARIKSGSYPNQLYTSINNVLKEFDRYYVFVVNDKDIAVRTEVQLGNIVGENVIINSGVNIGDKIVVSGMENLEDNTLVQVRS